VLIYFYILTLEEWRFSGEIFQFCGFLIAVFHIFTYLLYDFLNDNRRLVLFFEKYAFSSLVMSFSLLKNS